ncbi:PREDICTED: pre-B-cell leukemia transcription factor-interacting protein 1 isoform X2 [Dipodomys ordii]|uniref:Pre-B-cell leukemia transcription factor-interacting protein 1 isoform X2 n=1 Tax=Dipodomys ordii TaxID=10020 RepID=A0A1S3F372_DIPOR|nr:PREDICTED: pre-B-cell leukemia transcription factor-interacting protein 1 isoform X2 [Dipodomys ordii]
MAASAPPPPDKLEGGGGPAPPPAPPSTGRKQGKAGLQMKSPEKKRRKSNTQGPAYSHLTEFAPPPTPMVDHLVASNPFEDDFGAPKVAAPTAPGTSATMASCPDSDNSWVLAGSENLPVETLGPEHKTDPESKRSTQDPGIISKADGEELVETLDGEGTLFQTESPQNESPTQEEETKAKGVLEGDDHGMEPPGPGDTLVQEDLPETSMVTSLGPDTEDLENPPPSPKTGGLSESETGTMEEAELQVFPDPGLEAELVDAVGDRQDGLREQLQASVPSDGVPSLQNMGLLLDKLAKENQDIRLLQAQLQAQKEELQSLMQQPKGLEEENARLRGALQQGEASQKALESELQQLRARLQGLEANCVRGPDGVCLNWGRGPQGGKATEEQGHRGQEPDPGFLEQQKRLEAEAQALRQELQRQRRLLGSVQQDLQRGLKAAGRGAPAHASLTELGHRLAQTLQGLEHWGKDPAVRANASESWHRKPHFQNPREWSGKEKWHNGQRDRKAEPWKHKKEEFSWEKKKKSWEGEEDQELSGRWKEGKQRVEESGSRKDGKRQDPKESQRKSGSPHSEERQKHPWGKEGAKGSHDPLPPWEQLLRHKYRAPQGCSGVDECARQEGLAFFGMELAPVRQHELASLLRTYLARLPWAGQLTQELPLSPAYFGEDGIFRHDRLRFRDFVDALEDSLEEVAVRQTGDDDEVDDFEDFIFSHFFGDKALKKRSGKKDKHLRNPRVVGSREEHSYYHHHQHHHRG